MRANELPDGVEVETVYLLEVPYTSEAAERRPPVRGRHLARIAALHDQGRVLVAGGCLDWSKAVLLVRAPNAAAALRIAAEDVYTAEGVWHSPTAVPFGRIVVEGSPGSAIPPESAGSGVAAGVSRGAAGSGAAAGSLATTATPADTVPGTAGPAAIGGDDPLVGELLRQELALARRDPTGIEGGLETLLDEDFEEVGASGKRWDRASVVDLLVTPRDGTFAIERFGVVRLADDVALVTYDSIVERLPEAPARVGRSSLWLRRGDRWRMRYHQGTRSHLA